MHHRRLALTMLAAAAAFTMAACDDDDVPGLSVNAPEDLSAERVGDRATELFDEVNIEVTGVLICDLDFGDGNVSGDCEGLDTGANELAVEVTGTGNLDDGTCDVTITAMRDGEVEAEESGFDCLEGIDTSDE